jgi:hypothetical protein
MPSPTRSKILHLIIQREGDTETPVGVISRFKSAYSFSLLTGRIANPNLSERTACRILRKNGKLYLWNKDEFAYEEEALWSPIGRMIIIQKVPVIK